MHQSDATVLTVGIAELYAAAVAPAAKEGARPAAGDSATFNDDEHHVRFRYPAAWKKEEAAGAGAGAVPVAAFLTDPATPEGKIEPHVYVQLHHGDAPIKESTIGSLMEGVATGVRKQLDPSMKVTDSGPATLGGRPGRRVVLTGKVKGAPCSYLAIATIRGGKAYSVSCVCDPEALPKFKADVQTLADSFQWTDAAPSAKPAPGRRGNAPAKP